MSPGICFLALRLILVLAGLACCAYGTEAIPDWRGNWELPDGFSINIDVEAFDFPTAIAFVPRPGSDPKSPLYFVAEIRGKIKVVTRDRTVFTFAENFFNLTPSKELPSLDGETGMAAVALDPTHGYVFVSFTYQDASKILRNGMIRFDSEPEVFGLKARATNSFCEIFKGDIARLSHQIGGMAIDGNTIYAGVGDGGQHFRSQNLDSTLGKIVRMSLDGKPLPDNPFYDDGDDHSPRNFVWASGLRNPFGLCLVNKRLFASENGFNIDRFLEIQEGKNFGWDGTDWSIGMNAPMVIGPTVAPVHVDWLPADNAVFPAQYRSKFYVALAGGKSASAGVATIEYDFTRSCLGGRPRMFAQHMAEKTRELDPVGVAFGPDALYVVPLYPVRAEKGARGAVLRISYDPKNNYTRYLGRDERAQLVMTQKDCYNCHGQHPSDLNVAPPLDRETLVPRILQRLRTEDYRAAVRALDSSDAEPYKSYRKARRSVLAASGMEQAHLWIKYHVMEPMFDTKTSAMPNLGLTEKEAEEVSDYLMRHNIGDVGVTGFFKSLAQPYLFGPAKRRHLLGAFGMGFSAACLLFLVWRVLLTVRNRPHNTVKP